MSDYLELAFSFQFEGHTIKPSQIKSEIQKLLSILEKGKPKTVLEIGTSNGGTLFLLCKAADVSATIISVDLPNGPFGGELYPDWKISFYQSFKNNTQKIHLLRNDSHDVRTLQEIKRILNKQKIDFLLIDGDHSYGGVKKDFELYGPLIGNGGIIAFHDINHGTKDHVGEVPQFWQEIKHKHPCIEIIDDKKENGYGFGLIFVESAKNTLKKYADLFATILEIKDEELSEAQNNPLGILHHLHSKRPDLQKNFPNMLQGEYDKIIQWAAKVASNEIEDSDASLISKFSDWFKEYQLAHKAIDENKKFKEQNVSLDRLISEKNLVVEELESVKEQNVRKIEELESIIAENGNRILGLGNQTQFLKNEEQRLVNELDIVRNSVSFRLTKVATSFLDDKLPPDTKLGKIIRKIVYDMYRKRFPQPDLPSITHFPYDYEYEFRDTLAVEEYEPLIESFQFKPKISIIMPVYNTNPLFLKKAVESVKNQYYTNWQLCICDDGSTNNEIIKILNTQSSLDNRIKITFSKQNEGISLASNKALSHAEGEFVLLLDHDDILAKNALLEVVKTL
ncbi:MAG: CmcI family methyltransferase, partial [Nitrosopumilaceae archaeon]